MTQHLIPFRNHALNSELEIVETLDKRSEELRAPAHKMRARLEWTIVFEARI
jgi:hypothetical protein